ncbi:hypothetical protein CKJ63_07260 [Mycobacterium avium]|uniref:hypothetical protein n=1 Tax=Mycobacterium avium TaxID=1764 RepID=UPI000B208973|nr:hypothetical protein [Mycobacterium avium]PBA42238.1 hypothetical protein CKJ63_07260 [Mycobacterium avium]PBA86051.1 hypothetical protein CKJ72_00305 [Mycobacterium avium]
MTATATSGHQAAAEAKAAWSTMRADRRFLWFWLSVATLLSVAGNVGHAWLTVGVGATRFMAIGWAVAPPALLMLAIHGLPTLARMLGSDERDKLLSAVVWGVTVGAFGWSAFGIFGFSTAMGLPSQMAWVAPFVIDLSVFGATRGLVLTAPMAARMKVGIAPVRIAAERAAGLVSPPPVPPQTAADPQSVSAAPPLDPAAEAPAADDLFPAADLGDEQLDPTEAAASPEVEPDTLALAEHIVASGAVRKPVETVAAILAVAAEGESRKATIAERSGVHHSVVTKTLDAAKSHRRQHIAAVG